MDRMVKCVTNDDKRVPIVRVWLKMNGKKFEEHYNSISSGYGWKTLEYELSLGDLMDLIDYINMAEVRVKDTDLIV